MATHGDEELSAPRDAHRVLALAPHILPSRLSSMRPLPGEVASPKSQTSDGMRSRRPSFQMSPLPTVGSQCKELLFSGKQDMPPSPIQGSQSHLASQRSRSSKEGRFFGQQAPVSVIGRVARAGGGVGATGNHMNGTQQTAQSQHREEAASRSPCPSVASSTGSRSSVALSVRRRQRKQLNSENIWPDPHKYNTRSLYLLTLDNPLRRLAIKGIECKWWDRAVLALIFFNTIQLALYDPFDIPALKPVSVQRDIMDSIGIAFSAVFLAECLVKITAMGFVVGPRAYLKDSWNYLDVVVVVIGVIDFFPSDGSSSNLSALRSLRVMRPLRLVNKFPELRDTVSILINCIPDLSNAVGLVMFILVIFGILGVQLFAGVLRGVCFNIDTGAVRDIPSPCGYLACASGHTCLQLGENPSRGVVTFDYIGASMMTVFQIMTYEGWNDIMYAVQDSLSPYAYFYFLALILVGPIFALQLFLVVISNKYNSVKLEEAEEALRSADALREQEEQALTRAQAMLTLPVYTDEEAVTTQHALKLDKRSVTMGRLAQARTQRGSTLRSMDPGGNGILRKPIQCRSDAPLEVSVVTDSGGNGVIIDSGGNGDNAQQPKRVKASLHTQNNTDTGGESENVKENKCLLVSGVAFGSTNHAVSDDGCGADTPPDVQRSIRTNVGFVEEGGGVYCGGEERHGGRLGGEEERDRGGRSGVLSLQVPAGPRTLTNIVSPSCEASYESDVQSVTSAYKDKVARLATLRNKVVPEPPGDEQKRGGVGGGADEVLGKSCGSENTEILLDANASSAKLSRFGTLRHLVAIAPDPLDDEEEGGEIDDDSGHGLNQKRSKKQRKRSLYKRFKRQLRTLAMSNGLSNFVMAMICLSTFIMALDSHVSFCEPPPENSDPFAAFSFESELYFNRADERATTPPNRSVRNYKAITEGSNLFFTAVFVLELLIKIGGLGFSKFALDGKASLWNLFDVVIVVISVYESSTVYSSARCLFAANSCLAAEQCSAGVGYAVMRVLRLGRLGKLLRAFPDIYKQVTAIGKSLGAVGALMTLILLFLLIFTILGMNVFGGAMTMEFDAGQLMRGADVYVELPFDPWRNMRPLTMPGRRGTIVDVDAQAHPLTPWKVLIFKSEGLERELALDTDRCVWAADGSVAGPGAAIITGIVPRLNYDSLGIAIITTFQILTTANWNDDLYDAVATSGAGASFFFYTIIVAGNWMLLNMFIAIIIQKFAEQRKEALDANLKEMKRHFVARFGPMTQDELNTELVSMFAKADADGSGLIEKHELMFLMEKEINITLPERHFLCLYNKYDEDKSGEIDFHEFLAFITDLLSESEKDLHTSHPEIQSPTKAMNASKLNALHLMEASDNLLNPTNPTREDVVVYSLWCLAPTNPLRVAATWLTMQPRFEHFILVCIFYSSVTLALDQPLLPDTHALRPFLVASDYIMNFVFITECLLKIVSQTFRVYIGSSWSRLDVLIVTTAIIDMVMSAALSSGSPAALAPLKTLRILRALRPLRLIARAPGLRVLISAMFSSVKPILGTIAIAISVYSLLGLVGMQILLGSMGTCSDTKIKFMRDCWGQTAEGEAREWINNSANFDVLPVAVVTMFTLATQDDWPTLTFAGIDAIGQRLQPEGSKYAGYMEVESAIQNANPNFFAFYFLSIMVGGYLVLNMFVSVFVDGYLNAAEQMKIQKEKEERERVGEHKLKLPMLYDDPESWLRCRIIDVISCTEFDLLSAFLIVANIVVMAFESYKPALWQMDLGTISNSFFTLVFGWEALFKLYVFGGARYFASGWNKFDFFIVMISYVGLLIDNLGNAVQFNPTVLRVLRIFRIFRILRAFRVFKSARGIQIILSSLASSIPALGNLFAMLLLVFFIFAALATSLFGTICIEGEAGLAGMGAVRCFMAGDHVLGLHANFRHMGEALGTLFRCSTSDAWREVLDSLAVHPARAEFTISLREWDVLTDKLGYDPRVLLPSDPRFNSRLLARSGRMELAKIAIQHWNASVYGMDKDIDWPTPHSVPDAADWIAVARAALPGCLTDDQVAELESAGLMDCAQVSQNPTVYAPPAARKGNRCQSTCAVGGEWNYVLACIFFAAFIVISNFVILQLVIAVLMDQMEAEKHEVEDGGKTLVLGCEELRMAVFARIFRRFKRQAVARYYYRTMLAHGHAPDKAQRGSRQDRECRDSPRTEHARLDTLSSTRSLFSVRHTNSPAFHQTHENSSKQGIGILLCREEGVQLWSER